WLVRNLLDYGFGTLVRIRLHEPCQKKEAGPERYKCVRLSGGLPEALDPRLRGDDGGKKKAIGGGEAPRASCPPTPCFHAAGGAWPGRFVGRAGLSAARPLRAEGEFDMNLMLAAAV
ncbi:hypothetical protein, partial [Ramlibacter sp. Leaf400]|uniref:hypothetical protein n=1 Tax=Ramlibacter sp. Leaf400 TaxID=1736365 RepID=UPI001F26B424